MIDKQHLFHHTPDRIFCLAFFAAINSVPIQDDKQPFLYTFVMPVPVAEPEPALNTLGDVNGDSMVNASDAAQILFAAAAIGAGQEVRIEDSVKAVLAAELFS